MKTLDAYMKLPYKMEIVPDTEEGGYVVSCFYIDCIQNNFLSFSLDTIYGVVV